MRGDTAGRTLLNRSGIEGVMLKMVRGIAVGIEARRWGQRVQVWKEGLWVVVVVGRWESER